MMRMNAAIPQTDTHTAFSPPTHAAAVSSRVLNSNMRRELSAHACACVQYLVIYLFIYVSAGCRVFLLFISSSACEGIQWTAG